MKPDYSKYTLKQLLEAKSSIDASSYPERIEEINLEIVLRKRNGDETFVSKRDDSNWAVKVVKFMFFLLSVFFASRLYEAWSTGVISLKGKDEFYLTEQPEAFYFVFVFHVLMLSVFLFLTFSNRYFKKHDV